MGMVHFVMIYVRCLPLLTSNTKKPGSLGDDYLKSLKDERSKHQLKKIFDHLDYLTVYIPAVSVQTLDSVIFEALLKR